MAAEGGTASAVVLRAPREHDAEAVAALFAAVFGSERPTDAQEIASWVSNSAFDPEWLRVLEVDGRIVGYGDLWLNGDDVAFDVAAPGHWDTFFDWAKQSAESKGARRVRVTLPAGHQTKAFVEARGYRLWRSNYTMEVALDDLSPEVPRLPTDIEARHRFQFGRIAPVITVLRFSPSRARPAGSGSKPFRDDALEAVPADGREQRRQETLRRVSRTVGTAAYGGGIKGR